MSHVGEAGTSDEAQGWCLEGWVFGGGPAHHRAAAALDEYVEAAELAEPKAALFQSVDRAGERLTGRALTRPAGMYGSPKTGVGGIGADSAGPRGAADGERAARN